jgi:AraC-like DNA-binding protein
MPTVYERDAKLPDVQPHVLQQTIRDALAAAPLTTIFRLQPTPSARQNLNRNVNRITLVLNGTRRIAWSQNGVTQTTELTPGAAIVVPRRSWSHPQGPQKPHRYLSIDCYPTFTRFMCEYHRQKTPGHGVFYTGNPPNACARHLLEALTLLPIDHRKKPAQRILLSFLEEILPDCQAWSVFDPGRQHWQEAACWIQDNLSPEVGRHQIAAAIGVHPNHLSRICHQQTGERLSDFLTRFRIERAQDLLTDTDLPIRTIVSQAGYRDETHFRKRFKEVTGLTPGAYRKQSQAAAVASG